MESTKRRRGNVPGLLALLGTLPAAVFWIAVVLSTMISSEVLNLTTGLLSYNLPVIIIVLLALPLLSLVMAIIVLGRTPALSIVTIVLAAIEIGLFLAAQLVD